jgi:hypothetical protein
VKLFEFFGFLLMIILLTASISELKDRVSKIHYELDKKITSAQIKCVVHQYAEK